jgi:hypothetical protein
MGEEGRKFLRYVMPGLVFGVETLVLLTIAFPEFAVGLLEAFSGKDAIGAIAGTFLASGALGYIFASFHHWYLWHFEEDVFDHRQIITKLREMQKITLDEEDVMLLVGTDTLKARERAQSISLGLWYYHLKSRQPWKDQLEHLGNQAHGLGTARVASIFAVLTTMGLCMRYGTLKCDVGPIFSYVLMIALGGFICYVFHVGYSRVARFAHTIYGKALVELYR